MVRARGQAKVLEVGGMGRIVLAYRSIDAGNLHMREDLCRFVD